jgi:diketogulonate reductase-like aldo/keto reductase
VGVALRRAVADGLVARADLFVATKLSDDAHAGYANTVALGRRQLQALQLEYIDLYYLHSPLNNDMDPATGTRCSTRSSATALPLPRKPLPTQPFSALIPCHRF